MLNEIYERYIELNMGFSRAFIYRVHPEGLYSQINMVLNAAAFSLLHKKRLIVDRRNFIGKWEDHFGVDLPGEKTAQSSPADFLPRQYRGVKYRGGVLLLKWAEDMHNRQSQIEIPELNFEGDMYALYRLLAATLCPHPKPIQPPFAGDYVACHVRRGDKLVSEGQFHDVSAYLDLIQKFASHIKNIFIITDDYRVIENFREQASAYNIATMCEPHERGYDHRKFLQQNRATSVRQNMIMKKQIEIACASHAFFGCYLANPSRFVALTHQNPARCFSVDVQKIWIPGLPQYQKKNIEFL